MRSWLAIILIFTAHLAFAEHPASEKIRNAFAIASQDKDYRETFIDLIQDESATSSTFQMAYLGVAKTLMAEVSLTPWTKYTLFKDGTDLIEKAILQSPNNAEYRYLRFLVQFNAPSFLDYNDDLAEDYAIILKHIQSASNDEVWAQQFEAFQRLHHKEISERISKHS